MANPKPSIEIRDKLETLQFSLVLAALIRADRSNIEQRIHLGQFRFLRVSQFLLVLIIIGLVIFICWGDQSTVARLILTISTSILGVVNSWYLFKSRGEDSIYLSSKIEQSEKDSAQLQSLLNIIDTYSRRYVHDSDVSSVDRKLLKTAIDVISRRQQVRRTKPSEVTLKRIDLLKLELTSRSRDRLKPILTNLDLIVPLEGPVHAMDSKAFMLNVGTLAEVFADKLSFSEKHPEPKDITKLCEDLLELGDIFLNLDHVDFWHAAANQQTHDWALEEFGNWFNEIESGGSRISKS